MTDNAPKRRARDESVRDELEARTRELEALSRFPEMNPGPVLQLDTDGVVKRANPAARRVFAGDLIGMHWQSLFPDLDHEIWHRAVEGDSSTQFETDVAEKWLLVTLAHAPDTDTVFAYCSDVTARRDAELALEARAAELRDLARFPQMNPGPVGRLHPDGTIVAANPAAHRFFGRDELVGCRWHDVCPGVSQAFLDTVPATDGVAREARISGTDVLFTYVRSESQVFVYGSDVTELNRTQRALQQREKMATLGTLAAGVAHELNNPAAAAQRGATQLHEAIQALQETTFQVGQAALTETNMEQFLELDMLARDRSTAAMDLDPIERSDRESDLEDWLDERGIDDGWELAPGLAAIGLQPADLDQIERRFEGADVAIVVAWLARITPVYALLDEIRHGAGRIADIVGALKAYSYLGQGPRQQVDVNDGIDKTLVILRNRLKRGVTVVRELDPNLPTIQAYGSELNQVWTNLIDNAVDAMDGEGTIILRSREDGPWIVVECEDDGPGIPPDVQDKMFDAFFTTKSPGHGTGLGLHTCYNVIVEKHKGTLECESEPGLTRFTVRIPQDPEPTESGRCE